MVPGLVFCPCIPLMLSTSFYHRIVFWMFFLFLFLTILMHYDALCSSLFSFSFPSLGLGGREWIFWYMQLPWLSFGIVRICVLESHRRETSLQDTISSITWTATVLIALTLDTHLATGQEVEAVFGFCSIRNFGDATDVLKEKAQITFALTCVDYVLLGML